jgi:hypothetical protein
LLKEKGKETWVSTCLAKIQLKHAGTGGGMLRARVGFSPGKDFINIFLLVLYIKKFIILEILKIYVKPSNMML